jgi:hypothetical protein
LENHRENQKLCQSFSITSVPNNFIISQEAKSKLAGNIHITPTECLNLNVKGFFYYSNSFFKLVYFNKRIIHIPKLFRDSKMDLDRLEKMVDAVLKDLTNYKGEDISPDNTLLFEILNVLNIAIGAS